MPRAKKTSTPIRDVPVKINGGPLAVAWQNAWLATGQDEERPALYKTLIVEVHRHGLQLVATDSFVLFGAFAPFGELSTAPELDEAPLDAFLVGDWDSRGLGLVKYAEKEAKAAAKEDRDYLVTLELGKAEPDHRPALDLMSRRALILSTDTERLALPLVEIEPPNWRAIISSAEGRAQATDHVFLTPSILGRFGAVKGGVMALRCGFSGTNGPIVISSASECHFFAAIVPQASTERGE